MYADADDVGANLGRPLSPAETAQARLWIRWTEDIIEARMGSLATLNQDVLNRVIVEAVTRRLRMPEPLSQASVRVDDASVTKTYQRATGLIEILPEWWEELGWIERPRQAFSIRPAYAPGRR